MNEGLRRSERFSWLSFEAKVHMKRSFFVKEWIPVFPFDFSRFGMGVQTDEVFQIGEQIQLEITLAREDLNVEIGSIYGVVRYKKKVHSRFDYGVEFVYSSKTDEFDKHDDLLRIEKALQHYENSRAEKDSVQV